VVDGQRGASYDAVAAITFSDDGSRVGYKACKGGSWRAVVDGQEGPEYESIGKANPVFSPDGKRVAYMAKKDGKWRLVVDGREAEATWDTFGGGDPVFSPDGKRIAYEACRGEWEGGEHFAVVDGQVYGPYSGVWPFVFSSDSARIAFKAKKDGKMHVVVDGEEGPAYDAMSKGSPMFSPDGKSVAYHACNGEWDSGEHFSVLNGETSGPHVKVWGSVFSPDGTRFCYVGKNAENCEVFVNGEVIATHGEASGMTFSADGARMGYQASRGEWEAGRRFMIIDGVEGTEYETAGNLAFSPSGKHVAYAARRSNSERFVVLDGQEGPPCAYIIANVPHFVEDDTVEYLAEKDMKLVRITQRVAPAE
jgi:roadblock/LC7 domain-containing protein